MKDLAAIRAAMQQIVDLAESDIARHATAPTPEANLVHLAEHAAMIQTCAQAIAALAATIEAAE